MKNEAGDTLYLAFSNLSIIGNSYLTTAAIVDTITISNSATYSFILLDSIGNIIWKKHRITGEELVIYDIVPKSLTNIGTSFYMLRYNINYITDSIYPVFIRFDINNKTIKEIKLADYNFYFLSGAAHLLSLNTNYHIAAVSAKTLNNSSQKIFLYLIDTNGNTLTTVFLSYPGFDEHLPKLIRKDNDLLLFSSLFKQSTSIPGSGFDSRIIARRIDTLGNFIDYFYQGSFADSLYKVEDVIKTQDGGYLIATQRYTYSPSLNYQITNGAFLKLSSNGIKQWLYYPGPYQIYADTSNVIVESNNVIELPNGEFMVSGTYHHFIKDGDTLSAPELRKPVYFWFLSKLSPDGKLIWNRLYNYIKPNNKRMFLLYNYDLDTCPDKGYILSGHLTDLVNELSSGWLVKVDSMGCLLPGCHLSPPEVPTDSTVQVLLYPNPADQFINFMPQFFGSEVRFTLVDMLGRIVVQGTVPDGSTNMIDSRELSAGMYLLEVHNDKYRITKKVLVQR
jgi:hypothetical protein